MRVREMHGGGLPRQISSDQRSKCELAEEPNKSTKQAPGRESLLARPQSLARFAVAIESSTIEGKTYFTRHH